MGFEKLIKTRYLIPTYFRDIDHLIAYLEHAR